MMKINFGSARVPSSDLIVLQLAQRNSRENLDVDGGLLASEVLLRPIFKNLAHIWFHVLRSGSVKRGSLPFLVPFTSCQTNPVCTMRPEKKIMGQTEVQCSALLQILKDFQTVMMQRLTFQ